MLARARFFLWTLFKDPDPVPTNAYRLELLIWRPLWAVICKSLHRKHIGRDYSSMSQARTARIDARSPLSGSRYVLVWTCTLLVLSLSSNPDSLWHTSLQVEASRSDKASVID